MRGAPLYGHTECALQSFTDPGTSPHTPPPRAASPRNALGANPEVTGCEQGMFAGTGLISVHPSYGRPVADGRTRRPTAGRDRQVRHEYSARPGARSPPEEGSQHQALQRRVQGGGPIVDVQVHDPVPEVEAPVMADLIAGERQELPRRIRPEPDDRAPPCAPRIPRSHGVAARSSP